MTAAAGRNAPHPDPPAGPSRLRVSVSAPAELSRVRSMLGADRGRWLGEPVDSGDEGIDTFLVDLELRVGDRAPRATFRKAAYVEVGPIDPGTPAGRVLIPISWRAAGMTPLFPVFAGSLTWVDDELRLDGFYEPPGGNIGLAMDRLLLNTAARATGRRLLERIAEAISSG